MLLLNPLPQRLDTGATPTFAGLLAGDGTAAAPSISFAADSDTGFFRSAANEIGVSLGGTAAFRFQSNGYFVGVTSSNGMRFASGGSVDIFAAGTNQNITLTPSGTGGLLVSSKVALGGTFFLNSSWTAGALAIGADGTDKVIFGYLGSTYSGPTVGAHNSALNAWTTLNYAATNHVFRNGETEVGRINSSARFLWGTTVDSGALLQIGTDLTTRANGIVFGTDTFLHRFQAGGLTIDALTGQNPLLILRDNGSNKLTLQFSAGDGYLSTTNGGRLIFRTASNTIALTLDASQNATFEGSVLAGTSVRANASSYFFFNTRSAIASPSDGVLTLSNNATTDFTRLQFGGTTASFPALGRSGTQIEVLLADGSAYAKIAAGSVSLRTAAANGGAGEVVMGSTTQSTVGAAGGASALPATPSGFLKFKIGTVDYVLPYYVA